MRYLAWWTWVALAAATALPAQTSTSMNMSLAARLPYAPCTTADVWSVGDFVYVARRHLGFSVVDLRNPSAVGSVLIAPVGYPVSPGLLGVNDIKSDGRYIYVSSEILPGGVYIYDISKNPLNPDYIHHLVDARMLTGAHNIWISGNYLYACANSTRRVEIYDISDPTNPVWLSSIGDQIQSAWAHDCIVLDNRAYLSFVTSGIAIYDVSNPRLPILLAQKQYPDNFTHNMWPTEDRRYLFTTDENTVAGVGGHVKIWDISALPSIAQVGSFKAGPASSIVHNAYVHGKMLFLAYYKEGVRVCDIQDPANPVEIAYYDTYAPTGPGCWSAGPEYAGAWGVHAWDLRRVFVSDVDSGGFVLRLDAVSGQLTSNTQPGMLSFDFWYTNNTPVALETFGFVMLQSINRIPIGLPLVIDYGQLGAGQRRDHPCAYPMPIGFPGPVDFRLLSQSGTIDPLIAATPRVLNIRVQ